MDEMLKVKILVSEGVSLTAAVLAGQQPFTALITYAGRASDSFVGGTEKIDGGPYRVVIPAELLKAKIKELEGKRVFASEDLMTHQRTKFIGEFVSAWIEDVENGLVAAKASGVLYRHVDPKLVDEIITLSRQGQMGFSYDLKDVRYELRVPKAGSGESDLSGSSGAPFIELQDFAWRGATILKREAAAYLETQLAASKAVTPQPEREDDMDKAEILKAVGEGMQAAMKDLKAELVSATIDPLRAELTASISKLTDEVAELKGRQEELKASAPRTEKSESAGETKPESASTVSASEIAGAVKGAVGDALHSLAEAIDDLKASIVEKEEKKGFRKSLSAQQIDVLSKYGGMADDEEPSADVYQRAIETVQTDIRLGRDQKAQLLSRLGMAKRTLLRAGMGGAQ